MVGYLGGPRAGALIYNLAHTYAGPIALGLVGVLGDVDIAAQLALIWLAHIGLDRMLGYGLKYHRLQGHPPGPRLTSGVSCSGNSLMRPTRLLGMMVLNSG
jgi:hypothetical protein